MFAETLHNEAECWILNALFTENTELRVELIKKDALLQRRMSTVAEEPQDKDEQVKQLQQQIRVLTKRLAFLQEEKARAVDEAEAAKEIAEELRQQKQSCVYSQWMKLSINFYSQEEGYYAFVCCETGTLYYVF